MATLQKRKSRGHTYWSIVESRRINGKPRPVILAYLGRAEDLLKRLQKAIPHKLRSYSHGAVAVLVNLAEELQVVETINRHLPEAAQRIRDGFTVGGSLLLAAIGRACQPTSKHNWHDGFARHTSLAYLLKKSLVKLDSQHFWDQMEIMPTSAIASIEEALVTRMIETDNLELDTLLCDMSNFFTYIASTNEACTLARRGKNKQRRIDLRQVGLLLMVTRRDRLPVFHSIYQGNLQDRTVFKEHFLQMLERFKAISGSLGNITLVFDQGNNSRATLRDVDRQLHFVGAVSPHHHRALIEEANPSLTLISVAGKELPCYRTRTRLWDLDLTVVVYISPKLREGQIRGLHQNITKLFAVLETLNERLAASLRNHRHRTKQALEAKVSALIKAHDLDGLIAWQVGERPDRTFAVSFSLDADRLAALQENWLGRRILITNRHDWSAEEIISAYWGQAQVEYAFKNMKNPFHLALRPQYHWTDQKIRVHGFICVLALLLSMVAHKRAREKCGFKGSLHALLNQLAAIRLATYVESPAEKTKGRYKVLHRIEEMDEDLAQLARGFGLLEKELKTRIPFSVYSDN